MSCEICGKSVTSSRAKYCSNACKQVAYRLRKKAMIEAKKNTLSMDYFTIAIAIDREHSGFFEQVKDMMSMYGVDVAEDVISLCSWMIFSRGRDE